MENATKALTIAGGVLIAIIVIATLLYSFQQWGLFPQSKDNSQKTSQDLAFNREFESYNKQNVYGADVITVINKAIENNERYGITAEPTDPYYVDIQIKLISPVYGYTKIYTRTSNSEKEPEPEIKTDDVFLEEGTYSISNLKDLNKLYDLTSSDPIDVKEVKRGNVFTRTETYSAEAEFKLRYFTCTKVGTHPENGRINLMIFEEVDPKKLNKI